MSARHTIRRSALAALHRLNRDRRVVGAVAFGLHVMFRCLPPILWDRFRWAQDFSAQATEACARDTESVLRRIFGEQGPGHFLPWRVTDVLGVTQRRMTSQGVIWDAERKINYWWAVASVKADQTGAGLTLEVRRVD